MAGFVFNPGLTGYVPWLLLAPALVHIPDVLAIFVLATLDRVCFTLQTRQFLLPRPSIAQDVGCRSLAG
jgi:hypothetical protein